ncbi:MAG: hypothetical protein MPJ24_01615 [Pirellulaceae bacterium]|nr:hypothetical protein [Pirellulaceae bacterium]
MVNRELYVILSRSRIFAYLFFVVTFFFCLGSFSDVAFSQDDKKGNNKKLTISEVDKLERLYTISPERTILTEPLKVDGSIDYVTYFNDELGEGVTPEKNFAVALLRELGPRFLPIDAKEENYEKLAKEYYENLQIDPLPKEGDYLKLDPDEKYFNTLNLSEITYAQFLDKYSEQHDRAMSGPWKKEDAPLVADYLAAKREHLDRLVEASKTSDFCYAPFVQADWERVMNLEAGVVKVTRLISQRAYQAAGEGDISAAYKDILAIKRIAKLFSIRSANFVRNAIAYRSDFLATEQVMTLLNNELPAEMLVEIKNDWKNYRRDYDYEKVSRYVVISRICTLTRMLDVMHENKISFPLVKLFSFHFGVFSPTSGETNFLEQMGRRAEYYIFAQTVDWDVVLVEVNVLVASAQNGTVSDRKLNSSLEKDLDDLLMEDSGMFFESRSYDHIGLLTHLTDPSNSRRENGKLLGKISVFLAPTGFSAEKDREKRFQQQENLFLTGLALEEYRLSNGDYPDRLGALVPLYFKEIPSDLYLEEGSPVDYQKEKSGYLLRSVGLDGVLGGLEWSDDIEFRATKK